MASQALFFQIGHAFVLPRQISDNRVVIENNIVYFKKSRDDLKFLGATTSRLSQIKLHPGTQCHG